VTEQTQRICWCGNEKLETFSNDYSLCRSCGTLVSQVGLVSASYQVNNDEAGFYGKTYWFDHQREKLKLPDIHERARRDLTDRCLHWLQTLLHHRLPPARVLEVGCAHGGFVSLLRWAGYDATGLELSPWIASFARQTFDVPVLVGRVEDQPLDPASFDVVVLNDVLEHLPDPVDTLRRCVELLRPEGLLLIQTPCFPDGPAYGEMVAADNPFLSMMHNLGDEHLYLFSQRSVRRLLEDLGCPELRLEHALFAYDMFLVASRQPLPPQDEEQVARQLRATAPGRMVLALLDKDHELHRVHASWQAAEADRVARLRLIESQGDELGRIPQLEADVEYLKKRLRKSEADRAARLAIIEKQQEEIARLHRSDNQRLLTARVARFPGWLKQTLRAFANPTPGRINNGHPPVSTAAALGANGVTRHQPVEDREGPELPKPWLVGRMVRHQSLDAYCREIDEFNQAQSNAALLEAIRRYNHTCLDNLARVRSLTGARLLDLGASPHGYALEHALVLGVKEYVGIGLDVDEFVEVHGGTGVGKLVRMNAEQLAFRDESFDIVLSLSTFEHVGDVARVLSELRRILKPGGSVMIEFEPIWTCSYGHHLHHFGPIAKLVPPWAHLVWDREQMLQELRGLWPAGAQPSLEEAVHWTYEGDAINRIGITAMRRFLRDSGLCVEWAYAIKDQKQDDERLDFVAARTGLSAEDLMTRGLSVYMTKTAA
jgi:2-polyprenyl-3-methyl-5-hydroxy-6-metoxy-1,4-benzoquinol methylase